jgi:hypothetical protein
MTNGPASYKIPAVADMPLDLRVKLVENRKNPEDTVFHPRPWASRPSCSVSPRGVRSRTVASLGDYKHQPNRRGHPERVLWGCEQMRQLKVAKAVEAETELAALSPRRCHRWQASSHRECIPMWGPACWRWAGTDNRDVEVRHNWIDALADLQNRGEPCVLVTIIEELGSTPRNAGSKMVISASQTFDTIGGGHLEYKAMQIAREMLASGKQTPIWSASASAPAWASAAVAPPCCCSNRWARCRRRSPCSAPATSAAHWCRCWPACPAGCAGSTRGKEFPNRSPGVRKIVSEEPVDEIDDLPAGSYCIVMTHNHSSTWN